MPFVSRIATLPFCYFATFIHSYLNTNVVLENFLVEVSYNLLFANKEQEKNLPLFPHMHKDASGLRITKFADTNYYFLIRVPLCL